MRTTTYTDDVACVPRAGTLYDVLELILDRGMVIDVFIRVSLVGIEILKIDARIVVASVDTYLKFAEACNRLDLERDSRSTTVPELFGGSAAGALGRRGVKRTAETVGDTVRHAIGGGGNSDDDAEQEEETRPKRRSTAKAGARRRRSAEDE
jgi:gas vesicle structural protein